MSPPALIEIACYVVLAFLDAARLEPPLGERSALVRLVLQEAEAAVLLLVVGRAVDDHLPKARYNAQAETRSWSFEQ